jgi:hypothetical protein
MNTLIVMMKWMIDILDRSMMMMMIIIIIKLEMTIKIVMMIDDAE